MANKATNQTLSGTIVVDKTTGNVIGVVIGAIFYPIGVGNNTPVAGETVAATNQVVTEGPAKVVEKKPRKTTSKKNGVMVQETEPAKAEEPKVVDPPVATEPIKEEKKMTVVKTIEAPTENVVALESENGLTSKELMALYKGDPYRFQYVRNQYKYVVGIWANGRLFDRVGHSLGFANRTPEGEYEFPDNASERAYNVLRKTFSQHNFQAYKVYVKATEGRIVSDEELKQHSKAKAKAKEEIDKGLRRLLTEEEAKFLPSYCSNCGADVKTRYSYCSRCGELLINPDALKVEEPVETQDVQKEIPASTPEADSVYNSKEFNKIKTNVNIALRQRDVEKGIEVLKQKYPNRVRVIRDGDAPMGIIVDRFVFNTNAVCVGVGKKGLNALAAELKK